MGEASKLMGFKMAVSRPVERQAGELDSILAEATSEKKVNSEPEAAASQTPAASSGRETGIKSSPKHVHVKRGRPKGSTNIKVRKKAAADDGRVMYGVWVMPESIKAIKYKAIDRGVNDYEIVQEALDAYFQK